MNKKTRNKPCNIELDSRIAKIIQWIVDGHNTSSIKDLCAKEFSVSERTAYDYISQAREKLKAVTPEQKSFYRNLAVERFNTIYQKAMADQKYQVAINAQVEMNKTLGLYEPEQTDNSQITITYTKAE